MPATPPTSPRARACYQERVSRTLGSPEQRRAPTPSTSAMPPPPPRQPTTYNGTVYGLPSNLAIGVHNLIPMPAPSHWGRPSATSTAPPHQGHHSAISIPTPASVSVTFY